MKMLRILRNWIFPQTEYIAVYLYIFLVFIVKGIHFCAYTEISGFRVSYISGKHTSFF